MTDNLIQALDRFIDRIDPQVIRARYQNPDDHSLQKTAELVAIYANEARVALGLIENQLQHQARVLEVGAGLCILSIFLKNHDFNVVALEPSAGGFGFFEETHRILHQIYDEKGLEVLELTAQALDRQHGEFDLIFSNNVLEHIPDLAGAVSGMCRVLKAGGVMVHSCPNYRFPYEPHLAIPVLCFAPGASKLFWRHKITENQELWDSLNFVTSGQVERIARDNSLSTSFEKHTLYKALRRIGEDPEFAKRHGDSLVGKVYAIIDRLKLLSLFKLVPAGLSTPMIFELRHLRN